jgi:hypothetical protein
MEDIVKHLRELDGAVRSNTAAIEVVARADAVKGLLANEWPDPPKGHQK